MLNIPPNREGRFSPADVKVLKETGKRIRETYSTDLLKNANGPKEVLDGDAETYIKSADDIVISMNAPITFNRILIQEAIRTNGERVEKHTVEAWIDGAWKKIAHATNIGYKRILRFPEVTTDKIRIRINEVRLTPAISNISAHHYQSRPPQPSFKRALNGMMTIEPLQQEFNWKAHGEDIAGNLNAGFKIYYTTDGTEPDANSSLYTDPFKMEKGELKAVAVLNRQKGAVHSELFGLIKQGWKPLDSNGGTGKKEMYKAFDADSRTYWTSEEGAPLTLTIDLGKKEFLSGFAYTPQQEHAKGMMAKGDILISNDGRKWEKAETFVFGNLINDPSKRFHYFKQVVKARYVRFETTEIAAGEEMVAIAEIDLF